MRLFSSSFDQVLQNACSRQSFEILKPFKVSRFEPLLVHRGHNDTLDIQLTLAVIAALWAFSIATTNLITSIISEDNTMVFRLWHLYRVVILLLLFPIVEEVFPVVLTTVQQLTDMPSTNQLSSPLYFLHIFVGIICTVHNISHYCAAVGRLSWVLESIEPRFFHWNRVVVISSGRW